MSSLKKSFWKAFVLWLIASLFFALTFVLNRYMDISWGSRLWSASLRFIFMLPILTFIVWMRGELSDLLYYMKRDIASRLLWSIIWFGIFYSFLCLSSEYGPWRLIAGTRQITIVCWSLLIPFMYDREYSIPWKNVIISCLILLGVFLMQFNYFSWYDLWNTLGCIALVSIAAIAYPLWNRKMMQICDDKLNVYQRILWMTLASIPLWIILSFIWFYSVGLPNNLQLLSSWIIAIWSWIIATLLFFKATDLTKNNMRELSVVEATQSWEVVFAFVGEMFLLWWAYPNPYVFGGILLIIIGMILHSLSSYIPSK